ncbi:MAG: translation elongation factor Ts [Oscillospiraceae bacterium]|jgi:elongation factor Ts|nr:translation elongation factor Ts [Oscillospiraceae bacterium]
MAFTAKDVAALREKTGCGMMDCKKALVETDGDMDKAIDFLREKGLAASQKKASRIAAEGTVFAYTEGGVSVVIEVNAETDFVAKNADFMAFVETCAKTAIANTPADVEALLECKAAGSEDTVAALLQEKVLTIGENIKIRRFVILEGAVASYIHAGGKIGVLVQFDTTDEIAATEDFAEMGKNIAMQIAAVRPLYIADADVPAEVVEKESAIAAEQLRNDPKNANKPANIIEKIVAGKIGKYYEEVCLLNQEYVKDGDMKVAKYIESVAKKLGGEISVKTFVRYEKGEGLQKREDNFADEVANMIK